MAIYVDVEKHSAPTNAVVSCRFTKDTDTDMIQNKHKRRNYAFTLKVNAITLIFFISTCFCVFLLISSVQEESYLNFIKNKNLKYILLWTRYDYHPSYIFLEGQSAFFKYRCPEVNCYVTSNKRLFSEGITQFDAILFNGRNTHRLNKRQLPKQRSPQQRYIFICLESAQNYPVCTKTFDNFFNWTVTYKLDSDILFPYMLIKNVDGEQVGPKINMKWINRTNTLTKSNDWYLKVRKKSKAAALFVSNCRDKSDRMKFVKKLQSDLDLYNLKIDIYGDCGTFNCPRDNPKCSMLVENDYFFYLALENSFSEDYVTEKLLTAVENFAIPIVYGGANYSRFLPPFSYIDGNGMSTQDIAALMQRLIQSPEQYLEYMWWRDHYSYHYFFDEGICNVCSALHDEAMLEKHSVYSDFRNWWNPNYKKDCGSFLDVFGFS